MARYVTRARGYVETPLYDDDRTALCPDLSVDGAKEIDTGLVSECGHPIMRLQDPIGFGREDER